MPPRRPRRAVDALDADTDQVGGALALRVAGSSRRRAYCGSSVNVTWPTNRHQACNGLLRKDRHTEKSRTGAALTIEGKRHELALTAPEEARHVLQQKSQSATVATTITRLRL